MALRVRTHVRTGQAAAAQGGGGGGTLIIDQLGVTPKLALSTRKLRTAYAGSAIQVRRSSDNTTQDIGFDGSGNLDTAALATFVGANSGFVSKWYDQSGAAADAVQATNANQPRIRNAGTNDTINAKPALSFPTAVEALASTANSGITNTGHYSVVADDANVGAGTIALFGCTPAGNGMEMRITSAGNVEWIVEGALLLGTSSGVTITSGAQHIFEGSYDPTGGAYNVWVDGTNRLTGTNAHAIGSGTIQLGTNAAGDGFAGHLAELIIFDLVGGLSGRTTLEADQKTYWGTP